MSTLRSRWAAVGAAVAITLGAGGIGLVGATSPPGAATFVPITPCRAIDTRPDFQVGSRSTPLGPRDIHSVTATGNAGGCSTVPPSATGVVLNVTATDATLPTFLTIWQTGDERPDASSLNPAPGQPPTPNAVTTGIDDDGQFSIYNYQGTVHVLADVVGYYTDHSHDDRYYTRGQVDDALAQATAGPWPLRVVAPDFVAGTLWLSSTNVSRALANGVSDALPGISTSAHVVFTLPHDHAVGADVRGRVQWIAQTNYSGFDCPFDLQARAGVSRTGVANVLANATWDDPSPSVGIGSNGTRIIIPSSGSTNGTDSFTLSGDDLLPGDRVTLELRRHFLSPGGSTFDDCSQSVLEIVAVELGPD